MIRRSQAAPAAALLSFALWLSVPGPVLADDSLGPGAVLKESRQVQEQPVLTEEESRRIRERTQREQLRRDTPEYRAYKEQAALTLPVLTFDVSRFLLPDNAGMLVVVEGTGGSSCDVYVYEKEGHGWQQRLAASGRLGKNGMNRHRTTGDKTTPIGVFRLNTPFGQLPPMEGFPLDYIQVDSSYTWTDDTNRLVKDPGLPGEHVGTSGYLDYYDYVLDMGFNPEAIPDQGSALFLHCEADSWMSSSGCVSVRREQMEEIMKFYGTWGEGRCFIALAPEGEFDSVYNTYGTNHGLSPED